MSTRTIRVSAVGFFIAAVGCIASGSLRAAALNFDDTTASDTITVSANDFENGLALNGAPFQSGIGSPATTTLKESDGAISFSGTWTTFGQQPPAAGTIYLVETPFDPAGPVTPLISDILQYQVTPNTDQTTATITGSFVSDFENNLGTLPVGTDPSSVFLETGAPVGVGFVGLGISATSDVPEPSSVGLAALGLVGLATIAHRRRKRSAKPSPQPRISVPGGICVLESPPCAS